MGFKAEIEGFIDEVRRGLGGQTCTIDSTSVDCVHGILVQGEELEEGGYQQDIDHRLLIRKKDVPGGVTITKGKKVTVEGNDYRIVRISDPAPGSHLELDLATVDQ